MFFSRVRIRKDILKNTQLSKIIYDNIYSKHRLLWDLYNDQRHRTFLYREEIAREQLGLKPDFRGEPIYYIVSKTKPVSDNPLFFVETKNYQPKLTNGEKLKFELRANPVVSKNGKKHDIVMNSQRIFLESLCEDLGLNSISLSSLKKGELKRNLLAHKGNLLDEKLIAVLKNNQQYEDCMSQKLSLNDKLEWSIKAIIDSALAQWLIRKGSDNGFRILTGKDGQLKLQNSAYQWHDLIRKAHKGAKSGFSSVDFAGDLEVTDADNFRNMLYEGIGRSKAFGCGLMLVRPIPC